MNELKKIDLARRKLENKNKTESLESMLGSLQSIGSDTNTIKLGHLPPLRELNKLTLASDTSSVNA